MSWLSSHISAFTAAAGQCVCVCLQGGSPRQVSLMASVHTQLGTEAPGRCHQPQPHTH